MRSFEIDIEPNWITSGYYLYIVTIKYADKIYLYIGQTGDNHYHKARAPLYRIGGHFAKGTSTENQIIKYFKKEVIQNSEISDFDLEEQLRESTLKYKFWKIEDYNPNDKPVEHRNKRMRVQAIEHYIIYQLQNCENLTVFNATVKESFSKAKQTFFKEKADVDKITNTALNILKELGYEG